MIAKFITIAPVSAVPAAALLFTTVIENELFATAVTLNCVLSATCPDRTDSTTTSPISTLLLFTTNTADASAASEVVSVVIAPLRPLQVTAVARLVVCVAVAPAPVA